MKIIGEFKVGSIEWVVIKVEHGICTMSLKEFKYMRKNLKRNLWLSEIKKIA